MGELIKPPLSNQEHEVETINPVGRFFKAERLKAAVKGRGLAHVALDILTGDAIDHAEAIKGFLGYKTLILAFDLEQWHGLMYARRDALFKDFDYGVRNDYRVLVIPGTSISSVRPRYTEYRSFPVGAKEPVIESSELLDMQIQTSETNSQPLRSIKFGHGNQVHERPHPGSWFTFCLEHTSIALQGDITASEVATIK